MDQQQQFCLKWNSFGSNLATAFGNLFKSESLADVTLFCDGVQFKAHRLILAACSKHFQDLFEGAPPSPSILVILDGTSSANMAALLEFMYKGEVHVSQEHLSSFLKAAECLQVKGLSIEHEKLAMVHGQQQHQAQREQREHSQPRGSPSSHENPQDSPNSRAKAKPNPNGQCKQDVVENGPVGDAGACYPPVLSPFMAPHHYRAAPYDVRSRRVHLGSPSEHADSVQRASVLRDSRERDPPKSPMSFPYRPSPEPMPLSRDAAMNASNTPVAAAVTFDRTAADAECHKAPADSRHADSSRPEDLRIKMEPSSRSEEVHSNAMTYQEADKAPDLLQPGSIWDSSLVSKTLKSVTQTDGKKLKCPFCERLYGYETNLRAHIRQRHQGIRVPCPFCSRTFTRNNTVRRHIAREHKTELNMKAFQGNPLHSQAQ